MTQTANYFNITVDDLCGPARTHVLVTARQIAMYLCRELTDFSAARPSGDCSAAATTPRSCTPTRRSVSSWPSGARSTTRSPSSPTASSRQPPPAEGGDPIPDRRSFPPACGSSSCSRVLFHRPAARVRTTMRTRRLGVTWPTTARNSQPSSPQKPCGQVPRTVDSVDKSAVDHRASPAGFEFSTGSQGTKHRPGQEIRESSTLCTGVMMTEKGKTSPSLLSLRLGTCG
jgi:hypothetical protein